MQFHIQMMVSHCIKAVMVLLGTLVGMENQLVLGPGMKLLPINTRNLTYRRETQQERDNKITYQKIDISLRTSLAFFL